MKQSLLKTKSSLLFLTLALSASALFAQSNIPTTQTTPPTATNQADNSVNISLNKLFNRNISSKAYTISLSQGGSVLVSYNQNIAQTVDHTISDPTILSQSSSTQKGNIKTLTFQPIQVGTTTLSFNISDTSCPVPSETMINLEITVTP